MPTTTLFIGRAGVSPTAPIANLASWDQSGEVCTLSFGVRASTEAAALALRAQVLGLADLEEPSIPVYVHDGTYGKLTTPDAFSGWYTVEDDPQVEIEPAALGTLWMPTSVRLRRVPYGWQAPTHESVLRGALRPNTAGITASSIIPWHGVLASAVAYNAGNFSTRSIDRAIAEIPGQSIRVIREDNAGDDTQLLNAFPRWQYPNLLGPKSSPVAHYLGACRIAQDVSEATKSAVDATFLAQIETWTVVQGRQIIQTPGHWMLGNSIVRVTPRANAAGFRFWFYAGGSWQFFDWTIAGPAGSYPDHPTKTHAVTVLANRPEFASLRLVCGPVSPGNPAAGGGETFDMDFSLRRGSRIVEIRLTTPGYLISYNLAVVSPTASSAITGGRVQTATHANGYRPVAFSPQTFLTSTANMIQNPADDESFFGVTFSENNSGSTLNDPQPLAYQYFAAQVEETYIATA